LIKMMLSSTTLVGGLVALAGMVNAACTRDSLTAAAETYIEAQSSGSLTALRALLSTSNFTYQENNKKAQITAGVLGKALKLDHNRTIADTTACASYTELISTAGPNVIGTQIRHDANGSVTLIDTIVATTGDWFFNAAKTLSYVSQEDWSPLAQADLSSRAALKAAADAYMDMWSNTSAINAVPWGSPCTRVEGGQQFTPSCKVGIPTSAGTANTNRRYVIDETVGSCDILNAFAGAMPDSHEFRLVGGKLRLVHTITV
jgi:hypothetical protein